jgi:hypothetical protein
MPRGVPKAGYRRTKNQLNGPVTVTKFNTEPAPAVESRFSINERFGFVSDMVTMLAIGDQASVIVTGPGGLGKSFTVTQALRQAGLQDVSLTEDFEVGETISKSAYRVVRGYSTAKGLYRALYENRNGVLVFDDTDSILRDPVSLNLLKAALDSYSRRIITYRADIRDDDLPQSFEFKGRVVFISNLSSSQIDQAILSRSMVVDLSMTTQQKVDRMRYLIDAPEFMPEFSRAMKLDALNLIDDVKDRVRELSLRSLIQCTKIRKSNPNGNWKQLAEFALCG